MRTCNKGGDRWGGETDSEALKEVVRHWRKVSLIFLAKFCVCGCAEGWECERKNQGAGEGDKQMFVKHNYVSCLLYVRPRTCKYTSHSHAHAHTHSSPLSLSISLSITTTHDDRIVLWRFQGITQCLLDRHARISRNTRLLESLQPRIHKCQLVEEIFRQMA